MSYDEAELLIPSDTYKKAGVIFGTQICTKYMRQFVYKILPDGFYLLDVKKTDERIRIAGKFLSTFDPQKIVVVSSRIYGQRPIAMMCSKIGCNPVTGRVIPGIFTNPNLEEYIEPEVVVLTDTRTDKQALIEASKIGIPVVALSDTDNKVEDVDLIIPANNKGRRSLALIYWLLTREIMRNRGILAPNQEPDFTYEDFITSRIKK
ncbi:MAG: 30S ribosomal protein S2 [Caldisphaeraceae archaeon]|nr:30S ribosomal protein S2 [Caldisphaeraceae archaeon]MEB2792629.1 30S ribosomal protein S2 [Caldisphaeraceae archaeon]MEB3692166.1 30S ribosomal protein S2 [Caldisphaeraceae archaeon]MEB3797949.1 30S ribosomal protein S2 [Caldisphaeraceae archaeon]